MENGVFVANPLQERTILMRKEGESAKSINEMLLSRLSRYRASPSATLAALTGSTISNTLKEDQAGALSLPDHCTCCSVPSSPHPHLWVWLSGLGCGHSGALEQFCPTWSCLHYHPQGRKLQLATAVHNTVLTLRKLRQGHHELEVSLCCMRSPQTLSHALKKKNLDLS